MAAIKAAVAAGHNRSSLVLWAAVLAVLGVCLLATTSYVGAGFLTCHLPLATRELARAAYGWSERGQ